MMNETHRKTIQCIGWQRFCLLNLVNFKYDTMWCLNVFGSLIDCILFLIPSDSLKVAAATGAGAAIGAGAWYTGAGAWYTGAGAWYTGAGAATGAGAR